MDASLLLVAQVAASDDQPRPLRAFIPLFIVAALLAFGIIGYIAFKLFMRLQKCRGEQSPECLQQDLESSIGHSSITCCDPVQESKDLKLFPSPTPFEVEFEEIVKQHTRLLSRDIFVPSQDMDTPPSRRSSSIFITRRDSLPLPARALLYPPSPRRASIPAMWSNPRSRWADETRLGPQRKILSRYPSSRPATSPAQHLQEPLAPVPARRSITPLL